METDLDDNQKYIDVLQVLKESSPYDFTEYSSRSINRRIDKIIEDNELSIEQIIYRLKTNKGFVEYLVDAITVNTTELFRDPEMWKNYIKELDAIKFKPEINIWHAGCSTGQEVYSNMIVLAELGLLEKTNIYASDISKTAISIAKKGEYTYNFNFEKYYNNFKNIFPTEEEDIFYNYFSIDKKSDILKVDKKFADKVNFFNHDLVKGKLPIEKKFDIIFCRNVLIYFNNELQDNIVNRFYKRLNANGRLILGAHELLSGFFKTKFIEKRLIYEKNNAFHFRY